MKLESSAFASGGVIPEHYTCKGENESPPLTIVNVPATAKSLAIIMHDPDAPDGDFIHWLVWNISPETRAIAANTLPNGAVQGKNGFNAVKYGGPCPPSGTHRYIFELYALDVMLALPTGADEKQLRQEIESHLLDTATLLGTVSA